MDRKPPAPMESREPKSIRFTPTEWDALRDAAGRRGLEPAVFARMLAMYALSIVQAPTLAEASAWIPGFGQGGAAQMLAGSRRTRRF